MRSWESLSELRNKKWYSGIGKTYKSLEELTEKTDKKNGSKKNPLNFKYFY